MPLLRALLSTLLTTIVSTVMVLTALIALAGLALHHLRPQAGDWQTQLRIPIPAPIADWASGSAMRLLPDSWQIRRQEKIPEPRSQHLIATPSRQQAPVNVPTPASALSIPISITTTLQWLTTPSIARLLSGSQWVTPSGTVTFEWNASTQTQTIECTGCTSTLPAFGASPIGWPTVSLSIQRDHNQLQGRIQAGDIQGRWSGLLSQQALRIHLAFEEQALHDAFALFASQIPEVARAQISGYFSLQAQVTLPSGRIQIEPQVHDFSVRGLGTETLPQAPNACAKSGDQAAALDGFLARAVIATEDQRFFLHPGYDLVEWQQSLQHNQARDNAMAQPLRGGSTLSQQLAKFVYTNGDRTALRKLRELLYAVEMEDTLGKQGILQQYLARVYWGEGTCGAQGAAQHYFHQSVDALNPAQAAWLAAMLHKPDAHAQRWQDTGRIDVRRTQWVIDQLRMPTSQRFTLRERKRWQRFAATHDWQRQP
ncbi:biosynthetic peptidoglycan transglycosylase [Lampropedia puyangensis]|nr:biosynthetic peptidoglycan transglycosylase [Lampropedia puyangensis]